MPRDASPSNRPDDAAPPDTASRSDDAARPDATDQPDDAQLAALGLYDPQAPDADDQLELVRYVLSLGGTPDDIAVAPNWGELALDLALRPRGGRTLGEVAAAEGVPWATAQRLMTAIGLAADPEARLTEAESETVRLLGGAATGVLGEEASVALARVAGTAMARVAETIVTAFRLRFELPRRTSGARYVDVVKEYSDIAQTMLPAFMTTLDALLRRQIVAVAERLWSTDEDRTAVTLPRAVGFVDLVGYTEATGSMSARDLADILVAFDERTAEVVVRHHGQVIKTIGDEALFVTEGAADACALALDLAGAFGDDAMPPVRVGLARGDVVSVLGDVFGPDVNLAARLVGVADPSTVVASAAVRAAVDGGFVFEALPPLALKGIPGPTVAYRVTR